jgi:predicted RNA-binding protein associated with RNAse of E/G family
MERRKYLGRYEKDFIKSILSKIVRVDETDIAGYVSLVQIQEVNHPCIVGEKDTRVCIADNGYSELTFLPDNENWQLTTIYDNHNNVVEWYIDITRKNSIDEKGNPYCDDMYLDAAILPNGRILILDEDELQEALDKGGITQTEFDMAYHVMDTLRENKMLDAAFLQSFCTKLRVMF